MIVSKQFKAASEGTGLAARALRVVNPPESDDHVGSHCRVKCCEETAVVIGDLRVSRKVFNHPAKDLVMKLEIGYVIAHCLEYALKFSF